MNIRLLTMGCAVMAGMCSCSRSTLPLTDGPALAKAIKEAQDTLVVMSYNVENFFDPDDDPTKQDDDFTPEGSYHWTESRMKAKAQRLARVVLSANGWHKPEVVGLCEVEGPQAVKLLVEHGGLNNGKTTFYRPVCFPTPDGRGIATAMLYDESRVELLEARPINVCVPDSQMFTRDVVFAHLKVKSTGDDYYMMVNHWPSKYGGAIETIWKRNHVATRVRAVCDSLLAINKDSRIVLMGDFNDAADVEALTVCLGAKTKDNTCTFRNLSADTEFSSYKYRGEWGTIDHIIVTPGVCRLARPVFSVVRLPFLLEPDSRYSGDVPKRTYFGRKFNYAADNNGGYSDHLPVMVKILM